MTFNSYHDDVATSSLWVDQLGLVFMLDWTRFLASGLVNRRAFYEVLERKIYQMHDDDFLGVNSSVHVDGISVELKIG